MDGFGPRYWGLKAYVIFTLIAGLVGLDRNVFEMY